MTTRSVRVVPAEEFQPPLESIDTELANARRLVALHGEEIRYCFPLERWLVWDGRRWAFDEKGELERMAKDTVRHIYEEAAAAEDPGERKALGKWAQASESRNVITNTVALARSEPGIAVAPAELDADPWLLTLLNGTLDLRSGELRPHDPADLITKLAPVEYDADACCPTWDRVLERILPSESLRIFLQRALGYSLTGDTSEQVLLFCLGVGANGKTTMLELAQTVLGDYALRAPFDTFLASDRQGGPRNDLARLRGARFVSAVEVEAGRRFSEVVIKELTGGDTIAARHLYSEHFEFIPQFKLWLAGNHKPTIRGTDLAIWRRIRLIPFTVTIPTDEQDRRLPEKLRAELPGILAWAVRGCLDWQREGLGAPVEVVQATQDYRSEMDVIGAFLDDRCQVTETARATAKELYEAYTSWCEAQGERVISQRAFGSQLGDRGFDSFKGTAGVRCWLGVGLA